MNVAPTSLHRRTNCGKPRYRFSYEKNRITLATPCFEPRCNTCAWQQPAISRFAANAPPEAGFTDDRLRRRSLACCAAVEQQLRRIGDLHVRNAPLVKVRGGRAEKSGRGAEQQRYAGSRLRLFLRDRTVLKFEDRLEEYRKSVRRLERNESRKQQQQQQQQHSRKVMLSIEQAEFARLAGQLATSEAALQGSVDEMKLFLIVKGDTMRPEWR
ncbi:hypothetical protein B0J12DRAFT_697729 [Macrophomina phaseolina]|uniref:Uncharacterized protein n=1 Tax=Macrophomina phaseolina TaxID=35725 RepID=A0ABQ8GHK4_9PEZI|nr:hypothetical protein B0J12DRAFT_697729 [Macrophomina phaseolina]